MSDDEIEGGSAKESATSFSRMIRDSVSYVFDRMLTEEIAEEIREGLASKFPGKIPGTTVALPLIPPKLYRGKLKFTATLVIQVEAER